MRELQRLLESVRQSSQFRGGAQGFVSHVFGLLLRRGPAALLERLSLRVGDGAVRGFDGIDARHYPHWIASQDRADKKARRAEPLPSAPGGACVILIPLGGDVDERLLRRAIASVRAQHDPRWRLRIIAEALDDELARRLSVDLAGLPDDRTSWVVARPRESLGGALDRAVGNEAAATVCMMAPTDVLHPMALFRINQVFERAPNAEIVYSDCDRIDDDGVRREPHFKTDFDPDLLLSHDCLSGLAVYRKEVLSRFGGLALLAEAAPGFDWALRAAEVVSAERIFHEPRVLCHRKFPEDAIAHSEPVRAHLIRTHRHATVDQVPECPRLCRVHFEPASAAVSVEILIPTRDRADLLSACLDSVFGLTSYPHFRICVIDNGSREPATRDLLSRLAGRPGVRILDGDGPFNFSALNNRAARSSNAEVLCLLNNDTIVRSPDWLTELVTHASRDGVGCVGARLWFADETIQHAGVVTGLNGCAGHVFTGLARGRAGYLGRAATLRSVSAVSAACMAVRRDLYLEVGGFDESLAVAFNDVDFSLKLISLGRRNVWAPAAELYHLESRSRGYEHSPERQARLRGEIRLLRQAWGRRLDNDPYHSPHLSKNTTDIRLARD